MRLSGDEMRLGLFAGKWRANIRSIWVECGSLVKNTIYWEK